MAEDTAAPSKAKAKAEPAAGKRAKPPAPAKPKRELSSFYVRLLSTIVLLSLFSMTMWGGHIPCALVMFLFQVRQPVHSP